MLPLADVESMIVGNSLAFMFLIKVLYVNFLPHASSRHEIPILEASSIFPLENSLPRGRLVCRSPYILYITRFVNGETKVPRRL